MQPPAVGLLTGTHVSTGRSRQNRRSSSAHDAAEARSSSEGSNPDVPKHLTVTAHRSPPGSPGSGKPPLSPRPPSRSRFAAEHLDQQAAAAAAAAEADQEPERYTTTSFSLPDEQQQQQPEQPQEAEQQQQQEGSRGSAAASWFESVGARPGTAPDLQTPSSSRPGTAGISIGRSHSPGSPSQHVEFLQRPWTAGGGFMGGLIRPSSAVGRGRTAEGIRAAKASRLPESKVRAPARYGKDGVPARPAAGGGPSRGTEGSCCCFTRAAAVGPAGHPDPWGRDGNHGQAPALGGTRLHATRCHGADGEGPEKSGGQGDCRGSGREQGRKQACHVRGPTPSSSS